MNLPDGGELKILGKNFLVNIALPMLLPNGLVNIQRDPRKQRIKPACYVGTVEEIGTRCQHVKVGDRIVFERYEAKQLNVDEERLIAQEREVVITGDETPMPDVIVLHLKTAAPATSIISVEKRYVESPPSYIGEIICLPGNRQSLKIENEVLEVGHSIAVQAFDSCTFRDGSNRLFFRVSKLADILLHLESVKEPQLQVI